LKLLGFQALSRFEAQYAEELRSITGAIVAYQVAFGEGVDVPVVRVDVWKLGAGEVHQGGHSAELWVESRKDAYDRDMEVLVIRNGYRPVGYKDTIYQNTTFELSIGASENADLAQAVGLMMRHEDRKAGTFEVRTLLPSIDPSRFREMVASAKELAERPVRIPANTESSDITLVSPDDIKI